MVLMVAKELTVKWVRWENKVLLHLKKDQQVNRYVNQYLHIIFLCVNNFHLQDMALKFHETFYVDNGMEFEEETILFFKIIFMIGISKTINHFKYKHQK